MSKTPIKTLNGHSLVDETARTMAQEALDKAGDGGNSGGGLPVGGEPNQQLVTDENGVAKWKAQDTFVVNITDHQNMDTGENEITADKTYAEIVEAAHQGKRIVGVIDRRIVGFGQIIAEEISAVEFTIWVHTDDGTDQRPISLFTMNGRVNTDARMTGYKFTTDGVSYAGEDTLSFSGVYIRNYFFIQKNDTLYRIEVNDAGELTCELVE